MQIGSPSAVSRIQRIRSQRVQSQVKSQQPAQFYRMTVLQVEQSHSIVLTSIDYRPPHLFVSYCILRSLRLSLF